MTINLPALPGDKVHVTKENNREYSGIMLASFRYKYDSSQLILNVMIDQADNGTNVIEVMANEIDRNNSSELQIPDPLEDGSVLDWTFNRKRVLESA